MKSIRLLALAALLAICLPFIASADPCEFPGSAECRDYKRCQNFPDFPGCGGSKDDGDKGGGGTGSTYCTFNSDKPGCREPGDTVLQVQS